eukprot:3147326-Amphidinium_carterae.1
MQRTPIRAKRNTTGQRPSNKSLHRLKKNARRFTPLNLGNICEMLTQNCTTGAIQGMHKKTLPESRALEDC